MSEQDTDARPSLWGRVQASERSRMHRQFARSVGEPTDERARQVWDDMSEEHRRWAQQAAWEGQIADHPHHALVVGDLQDALLRTWTRRRPVRVIAGVALAVFYFLPDLISFVSGEGVDTPRMTGVVIGSLVVLVAYVFARRSVRRRVDARLANLVRASEDGP